MGIESLKESVLESANKEAARIVAAARESAERTLNEQRATAQAEHDRRLSLAQRAVDDEYSRRLIHVRAQHNMALLEKRNAVLASVFEQTKAIVRAWPSEVYAGVMADQLRAASANAGGAVRAHADDAAVFATILESVNAGRSSDTQLTLDTTNTLPTRGGFIFVSSTYEVDRTLDAVIADLSRDLAPQVADALFQPA